MSLSSRHQITQKIIHFFKFNGINGGIIFFEFNKIEVYYYKQSVSKDFYDKFNMMKEAINKNGYKSNQCYTIIFTSNESIDGMICTSIPLSKEEKQNLMYQQNTNQETDSEYHEHQTAIG